MKYRVKIDSSNADDDTSQYESVTFVVAGVGQIMLAQYYTSRFMNGKTRVTLYDKAGHPWPRVFVNANLPSQRYLWDICVAHCAEQGYTERIWQ